MKSFLRILVLLCCVQTSAQAQEDAWSYMSDELTQGEEIVPKCEDVREALLPPTASAEDNDPLEDINRAVFWFNQQLDFFFLDRVSEMYRGVVPQYGRERVGYALRNLSEPIVFANNLLQGEIDEAAETLARFLLNSTIGLAGIFDVSTDMGFEYKKEDFGLTLAAWGLEPGPYIVIPILGPSNVRDTFGRIGDYALDPINWWAYCDDLAVVSNGRTGAQIVDAKTDNLDLLEGLKQSSTDYYATIRTWYFERRKDLSRSGERISLESPNPYDDD